MAKSKSYGGFVLDDQGRVLLREPTNHFGGYVWTLPKGGIDEGETPAEAALREVLEETGWKAEVVSKIPGTFEGQTTDTEFFLMRAVSDTGKHDWETHKLKWAEPDEAVQLVSQTKTLSGRERDLKVLRTSYQHIADEQAKAVDAMPDGPAKTKAMKAAVKAQVAADKVAKSVGVELKNVAAERAAKKAAAKKAKTTTKVKAALGGGKKLPKPKTPKLKMMVGPPGSKKAGSGGVIGDLMEAQTRSVKTATAKAQTRALALTIERLREVRAELEVMELGSWGYAERTAVMRRLQAAVSQLSKGQVDLLKEGLADTARVSARDAATWLRALDQQYLGIARPLRFDALTWIDDQANQLSKVRLQTYAQSFARYGASTVQTIENEIAKTILTGEPWTKARPKVMAAMKHAVGDNQWMVDRVLRTETSAAYNSMQLNALIEEDDDDEPMLKRLVATFDSRTGRDSAALHGQTVPVKDPFFDPYFGKQYMAPPNRPHDREIVVGWRASYGEDFEGGDKGYIVDTATPTDDAAFVIPGADAARAEGPLAIRRAMLSANLVQYRQQLRGAKRAAATLTDATAKAQAIANVESLVARINAVKGEQDQITNLQALLAEKKARVAEKAAQSKAKAAAEKAAQRAAEKEAKAQARLAAKEAKAKLEAERAAAKAKKAAEAARKAKLEAKKAAEDKLERQLAEMAEQQMLIEAAKKNTPIVFKPVQGLSKANIEDLAKEEFAAAKRVLRPPVKLEPGDVVASKHTGFPMVVEGFPKGGKVKVSMFGDEGFVEVPINMLASKQGKTGATKILVATEPPDGAKVLRWADPEKRKAAAPKPKPKPKAPTSPATPTDEAGIGVEMFGAEKLTVKEASDALGLKTYTIRDQAKAGKIPGAKEIPSPYKAGATTYEIPADDLLAWAEAWSKKTKKALPAKFQAKLDAVRAAKAKARAASKQANVLDAFTPLERLTVKEATDLLGLPKTYTIRDAAAKGQIKGAKQVPSPYKPGVQTWDVPREGLLEWAIEYEQKTKKALPKTFTDATKRAKAAGYKPGAAPTPAPAKAAKKVSAKKQPVVGKPQPEPGPSKPVPKMKPEQAPPPAATPTAAPKLPDADVDVDSAKWKQVGGQGGSNDGAMYQNTDTGEKWYVKTPTNEDIARNEILAAQLYRAAGVDVPDVVLGTRKGKPSIASKVVDGLKKDGAALKSGKVKGIGEEFVVDAWLANWDVVGMSYDNMLLKGDRAFRLDTGGALRYRAQGGKKGAAFGDTVPELESLRDASVNAQSASVFKHVTDEQIAHGIDRVLAIDEKVITDLVAKLGPTSKAEATKLKNKLLARREYLRNLRETKYKGVKPKAAPTKPAKKVAKKKPKAAAPEVEVKTQHVPVDSYEDLESLEIGTEIDLPPDMALDFQETTGETPGPTTTKIIDAGPGWLHLEGWEDPFDLDMLEIYLGGIYQKKTVTTFAKKKAKKKAAKKKAKKVSKKSKAADTQALKAKAQGMLDDKSLASASQTFDRSSEDHVRNELLAKALYDLVGVDAADVKRNGQKIGYFDVGTQAASSSTAGVIDGFVADAWLANWTAPNYLKAKGGKAIRGQMKGALRYRGGGQAKGGAFGNEVTELEFFRNQAKNPTAADLYKDVMSEDIVKGIDKVLAVTDEQITVLVDTLGPVDSVERKKLRDTLIARREDLRKKRASYQKKIAAEAKEAARKKAAAEKARKLAEKAEKEAKQRVAGAIERLRKHYEKALPNDIYMREQALADMERSLTRQAEAYAQMTSDQKKRYEAAIAREEALGIDSALGGAWPEGPKVTPSKESERRAAMDKWIGNAPSDGIRALKAWSNGEYRAMRAMDSGRDFDKYFMSGGKLDVEKIVRYREKLSAIRAAFKESPAWHGGLIRGVRFDTNSAIYKAYTTVGGEVTLESISSWGYSKSTASSFAGSSHGSLILKIKKTKKGVSIDDGRTSNFGSSEAEVMLDKGVRYRVVSVKKDGRSSYRQVVELEEIE